MTRPLLIGLLVVTTAPGVAFGQYENHLHRTDTRSREGLLSKAKPFFYAPEAARHLDFVTVHFHANKGAVDRST